MKKIMFLAGALIVAALSAAVFFTDKPLTEQEKLILRNVEAIAQNENGDGSWMGCEQKKMDVWEIEGPCENGSYKVIERRTTYFCYYGKGYTECWGGVIYEYFNCGGILINIDPQGTTLVC